MSSLLMPGIIQQQANRAGGTQYALEFDGVDDYALSNQISYTRVDVDIDLSEISPESGSHYFLSSGAKGIRYNASDQTLLFYINNINPFSYSQPNSFKLLSFRQKEDGYWDFYENDVLQNENIQQGNMAANAIGANQDGTKNHFNGKIKGLIFYNNDQIISSYDFIGTGSILYDTVNNNDFEIYGANWIEL